MIHETHDTLYTRLRSSIDRPLKSPSLHLHDYNIRILQVILKATQAPLVTPNTTILRTAIFHLTGSMVAQNVFRSRIGNTLFLPRHGEF